MEDSATTTRTFCRICVAACGLCVTVDESGGVDIRGDSEHPLSQGYCCPKGRSLRDLAASSNRLRGATLGRGQLRRVVDDTEAAADLGAKLATIISEHGPDAVAVYAGGGAQL